MLKGMIVGGSFTVLDETSLCFIAMKEESMNEIIRASLCFLLLWRRSTVNNVQQWSTTNTHTTF